MVTLNCNEAETRSAGTVVYIIFHILLHILSILVYNTDVDTSFVANMLPRRSWI